MKMINIKQLLILYKILDFYAIKTFFYLVAEIFVIYCLKIVKDELTITG